MEKDKENALKQITEISRSFARDTYVSLREAGFPSNVALRFMQMFSIALNDYVPSNYKPNRKEAP